MTTDRDGNRSNPYKPNPKYACECCIFGTGEHADWCKSRLSALEPSGDKPSVKHG
jgi:hypothetical protein